MIVTYYGHSCLLAQYGETRVIIDPFLSGNPASGANPADIRVNAVILTHGHGDHFGDALDIARRNDCPVIAPNELAVYCGSKGVKYHPMNPGGAWDFGDFRVKLTLAFHSSSVEEGDRWIYTGQPTGVLLTMGGKTLYHAGDTALFGDMKLIGELNRIDLAALPIGDNFTMGPEDAALAAEWLRVKRVVPIHYNTFPLIRQDPQAFAARLAEKGIACHILKSGDSLEV